MAKKSQRRPSLITSARQWARRDATLAVFCQTPTAVPAAGFSPTPLLLVRRRSYMHFCGVHPVAAVSVEAASYSHNFAIRLPVDPSLRYPFKRFLTPRIWLDHRRKGYREIKSNRYAFFYFWGDLQTVWLIRVQIIRKSEFFFLG